MFLSPGFDRGGASGGDGFSSGRISLDAIDAGESPTSLVANTVNTYFTLLVSPESVQVVVGHACSKPAAFTVYLVMAAPLSDGGAHLSTAVRLRTSVATGADGASGLSRTVIRTRPPTACLDGSLVLSSTVYRTTMTPLKLSAGVTVTESPETVG